MVLASSIPMTRKVLALAVVLIISSVAPASAVIGFCAKMPCCFGEAHDGPELGATNADCCTTISCYEAPSAKLTIPASASLTPVSTPAVLSAPALLPPAETRAPVPADTSPPLTAQHRRALLSVFLI